MNTQGFGLERHYSRIQVQGRALGAVLRRHGANNVLAWGRGSGVAATYRLPDQLNYGLVASGMAERGFFVLYGLREDPQTVQVSTIGFLGPDDVQGAAQAFEEVLSDRRATAAVPLARRHLAARHVALDSAGRARSPTPGWWAGDRTATRYR